MARSLNLTQIIGNAGADPDTREVSGKPVSSFKIAVTMTWGKGDKKQERTEWFNCVAWNNLSNIVNQIVRKGGSYYVQGRIQTRKWHDEKAGIDRYMQELIVEELIACGNKPENQGATQPPAAPARQQQEAFAPPVDSLPF